MAGIFDQMNVPDASEEQAAKFEAIEAAQNAAMLEDRDRQARYQVFRQQHADLISELDAEGNATYDNWEKWLRENHPSKADQWIKEAEEDNKAFEEQRKKLAEMEAEAAKKQNEALENSTFVDLNDSSYTDIPTNDDSNDSDNSDNVEQNTDSDDVKQDTDSNDDKQNNDKNDKKPGDKEDSQNKKSGDSKDKKDTLVYDPKSYDKGQKNASGGKDYTSAPKQSIEWLNEMYAQGIINDEQRVAGITLALIHGYLESENDIMKKLTDPLSYEKMSAMRTFEGHKLTKRMNRLKRDREALVSSVTNQSNRYNAMLKDIGDEKVAKAEKSLNKKSSKDQSATKKVEKSVENTEKESEPKVAKAVKTGVFAAAITGIAAKAGSIRDKLEEKFKSNKTEEVTNERTLKAFINTITAEKPLEKVSEKAKDLFNTVKNKVSDVTDKVRSKVEELKDKKDAEVKESKAETKEPVTEEVVDEMINNPDTTVADDILATSSDDLEDYLDQFDDEDYDEPEVQEKTIETPVDGTSFVVEATVQDDGTFVTDDKTKKQEQVVVAKIEEQQIQETVQQEEEEKKEEKKEEDTKQIEKRLDAAEVIMERNKQVVKDVANAKSVEEAEKIIDEAKVANNETVEQILDDKKEVEVNMKRSEESKEFTVNDTQSNINKIAADVDREAKESARISREKALEDEEKENNKLLGKLQKAKDAYDEPEDSGDRQVGE